MDNKIYNEATPVSKTIFVNELDMITDVLETEKNLSNNISIALNEMSNDKLYDKIYDYFSLSKENARKIYNLMFKYGWYKLEKAEDTKITENESSMTEKFNELDHKSFD